MGKGGGLTEQERLAVEAILAAAKTKLYDRVFFLGPYARRVSFSSQQNRALNLIWALRASDALKPATGKPVAVVGAGVSGLTATAALIDLGCKVTLYESANDVLGRVDKGDSQTA
jgi:NADPH-dependent 2,4-dienoyl-CoA reductase/sulfur reductase-like enzyme